MWNGVGTPAIRRPSMPSKRNSPEPLCSNPKAVHVIQKDASIKGFIAVLLQEERPVVCVSKTLTPA